MIQFYFLSVLCNIFGGFALAAGYFDEKISGFSGFRDFIASKPGLRVTLGVAALLTGVLKLLSPTKGDVPVVGDLLPSLMGMVVGATLLFERYKEKSTATTKTLDTAERFLISRKSLLGSVAVVVGFVHFLLPRVLLL